MDSEFSASSQSIADQAEQAPSCDDHQLHFSHFGMPQVKSTANLIDFRTGHERRVSNRSLIVTVIKHFFDLDFTPFHNREHPTNKLNRFREKIGEILEGHWAQILVILLLLVDMLLIIVELLLESSKKKDTHALEIVHKVFYALGITILSLFMLEIILKVFAFGWLYFTKFFFIIDAVIVSAALILEIVYGALHKYETGTIFTLLIVLRFWRLLRIVFSVAYSVKIAATETEHKMKARFKQKEELLMNEIILLREIYDYQSQKLSLIGHTLRSLEDAPDEHNDDRSLIYRKHLTEIHRMLF